MRHAPFDIREACPGEADRIRAMQEFSFRVLGCGFYRPEQIERFITQVGTLETALLTEGHYFIATCPRGEIVGSGGWSRLTPRYAATTTHGDGRGEGTVRAVYVAPSAARRGIGSAIMHRIEADAAGAGIGTLDLMSTLSGLQLYEKLGYSRGEGRRMTLDGGLWLDCVSMEKRLAAATPAQVPGCRFMPAR